MSNELVAKNDERGLFLPVVPDEESDRVLTEIFEENHPND